jgi:hypothetical protein
VRLHACRETGLVIHAAVKVIFRHLWREAPWLKFSKRRARAGGAV